MTTVAPTPSATTPTRRARNTPWPWAAVAAALAFGSAGPTAAAQGIGTYTGGTDAPSTEFVLANVNGALSVQIWAGVGLAATVATAVVLLGLVRFLARHARSANLVEAVRWCAIAFVATGSIGVVIRYIAAGGLPGGVDQHLYTAEATATIAVLSDQLSSASYLPLLGVMALVSWAAVRDRVFAWPVGAIALLLTTASVAMTLGLGLPYSSSLVVPVFLLVIGIAGLCSRRPA